MTPGASEVNSFRLASEATTITEFKELKGKLARLPINSPATNTALFVTKKYDVKYNWRNILVYMYAHLSLGYIVQAALFHAKWSTLIFALACQIIGGLGVTAGAHRYFTHRSYKVKTPLKIILLMMHSIANQTSLYTWVRDHRCHHKFNETDADPYNARRGLFFSHIGWLLVNKHPDVLENGKKIDMSDIKSDPYCMFQSRYFEILGPLFCFVIPTLIPWYFFGEDLVTSWYIAGVLKFLGTAHFTYTINSFGHTLGERPYDGEQGATDNRLFKYISMGESFHNYHHAFPWDYAIPEVGVDDFNITTTFIDLLSIKGWAYDKKVATLDIVKRRVLRTGDGSHRFNKELPDENHFWGWGDKDMIKKDEEYALIK